MKRIIDGKMYDTDESEILYIETSGINKHRMLYRTTNGNYFKFYANGEIVPLSEEQAQEYLGKYDPDKYIEIWGEVESW